MASIPDEYLGDGVYASFDGYQIWLKTQEGSEIALESAVFEALLDYERRLRELLAPLPSVGGAVDEKERP